MKMEKNEDEKNKMKRKKETRKLQFQTSKRL